MNSSVRTATLGAGALLDSRRPRPAWQVWLLGFVYTMLAGGIIQLVLLPHFFPAWVTPEGMLKATDSVGYHKMATAMARAIDAHGWSSWQLAPRSHFSVGFTALVYTLTTPAPWVMLPIKAGAHALCFAVLYTMAMRLLSDWRLALLCACPYLLFPSSALWYSQLLKDGYFNAGLMLFVLGWLTLASPRMWSATRSAGGMKIAAAIVLLLAGYLLMSLIRTYMFSVLVILSWLLAVLAAGFVLPSLRRHGAPARSMVLVVTSLAVVLAGTVLIRQGLIAVGYVDADAINVEDRFDRLTTDPDRAAFKPYWEETPWLPKSVDKRFAVLAGVRDGYLNSGKDPKSLVDTDVSFHRLADIAAYLPRALEIALLAPFPDMWLGQGSTGATTMMRRVAMLEMSAAYLALLFVPVALWRWRRRSEVWIVLAASVSMLMLYAVTTPNIGTLYRVRYGYLMLLITLGLAGACDLWARRTGRAP